ncbi:GNAT family N-acetyltransferase, partial [Streptomyces sp. NTH33]
LPGDSGACELRSVWVSPQARGRGVGDRLIAAVERWALQSGATMSAYGLFSPGAYRRTSPAVRPRRSLARWP